MKRTAGYVAGVAVVLGAFFLGFFLTNSEGSVRATSAPLRTDRPPTLVDEVRAELASSYYRWIDPAVLGRPNVDDILEGLDDPHTDYLTEAEYESLRETTDGSYSGIGLTVGQARNGLTVTSALRGPARAAGIRPGDVIVRIDGRAAHDMSFERSLALIKGEHGTLVHLSVERPHKGTLEFTVMRQQIDVPSINAHMVRVGPRKVAYIRVFSFPAGSADRIAEATAGLVEKGAKGAILDLRDNPGGLLSEAVDVTSVYLGEGIVCRTDGLHEEPHTYSVSGRSTQPDLPLVVLVDRGSASAAEILAGAFHDNDRAVLVGERTYGKASVQTVAPLSDGGALKLTTAKYLTPAGADITGRGIEPGIAAADDPLTERDEAMRVARSTMLDVLRDG